MDCEDNVVFYFLDTFDRFLLPVVGDRASVCEGLAVDCEDNVVFYFLTLLTDFCCLL